MADLEDTPVVVVSNRQPYSHGYAGDDGAGAVTVDRPAGGLTAGLDPVMQRLDGTWVAWGDGEADEAVVDGDDRVRVPPSDPSYTLRRVWLSTADLDGYYYGYSNRVLWPLCHAEVGKMTREPGSWARYRDVNRRFADAVRDELAGGDLVWFQDYHLALAPRFVRESAGDDCTLAQFWHVPWPALDVFRACPDRRALLDGLLANDLLGVHVPRYREQFLGCVAATFPDAEVDHDAGTVLRDGHLTQVGVFPMGVEADAVAADARRDEATAFWRSLRDEHDLGDRHVALGVDRLDYTKGIPERLAALEHLFDTRPEWRGRLTYVGKEAESRSAIPEYRALQDRVDEAVDRLNGRFATDDWQPVVRVREHLSPAELAGLYRHADVALVTPVRDGMNLVAQEYVAAQVGRPGVLVLSELTGVADAFDAGPLLVNPHDTAGLAATVDRALRMDDRERTRRLRPLRRQVATSDLSGWMRDVLATAAGRIWAADEPPPGPVSRA